MLNKSQVLGVFAFIGLIISLLFLPEIAFSQEEGEEWKLAKEKDGIEVYTRKTEGFELKEYKSIAIVDASPEKLLKILKDVDSYKEWMANVKIAKLLKDDEDRFYVYTEVNVPWPFDNRDQVTVSVVSKKPETGIIEIKIDVVADYLPENKGIIRLPAGGGYWIFTPLPDGKTELYHQFAGDPGGSIPSWLANMFLVDGPYKTMLGLKEFVLKKE